MRLLLVLLSACDASTSVICTPQIELGEPFAVSLTALHASQGIKACGRDAEVSCGLVTSREHDPMPRLSATFNRIDNPNGLTAWLEDPGDLTTADIGTVGFDCIGGVFPWNEADTAMELTDGVLVELAP